MILIEIQNLLQNENYTCSLFPASEIVPIDRLLISLGLDLNKRERMLEVISIEHAIPPELQLTKTFPPISRIQFAIELPFYVQDNALNQVASLLFFINRFIDLPGFELDELNGKVNYRYVWIINPRMIDTPLIMSIIGAVMLNLNLFTAIIENIAVGKQTFNDLLSEVIDLKNQS